MAPLISRRLRKGAATTAVAAAAMAALTASQAPGFASTSDGDRDRNRERQASESPAVDDTPIDGGSSYHTDLPPLKTPDKPGSSADLPGIPGGGAKAEAGIPATVLAAYKKAEAALKESRPGCNLPWQLLAAIGKVESGQARGGNVDAEGTTPSPILGPVLNGKGFAMIKDTDNGAFDGDSGHDRAVGPMQFIPSTWANWGRDGNGDGDRDPNNIYDAALAAGHYLCASGRDLSSERSLHQAILGYNHSQEYLNTVLSWFEYYKSGTHEVPDGTGVLPSDNRSGGSGPGTGGKGSHKGHGGGKGHGGKGHGGKGHGGKDTGKDPGRPHTLPKPDPDPDSTPKPPSHGGETPGPPSPKPPTTPAPSRPTALASVGAKELSATAGTEFAQPPRVRAVDAKGKPVAKAKILYEIRGETGARFLGLVKSAVVLTRSDGTATAPKLTAGEQTGSFTVRATADGGKLTPVEFKATVKARPAPRADVLARIGDKALKAETGGAFADPLTVKATYKGKVAAGVPVTATMVTADPKKPVQNDKGPYFLDEKGKPVRTLTGLKTNALGQLTLPKILADEHTGTYLLRLTTADGAVLTVELTVTQAAAS
ncbi:lytic transglycosylase domain-containing protein [Streptomyces sp. NA02950]|uniref:lytic transglycosylase domain-containing protein n=1 Tax=Streptomyces sp. NA02950 TaxID=2742137 RepID=UPI0015922D0B|nr:lytic transglycosylase domain-containing protein [Streptomyces sp. NA02950]QKV95559.1 lytic transglycosylase domain-containing protein [Streptomyces sp. NA02950]